MGHIQEKIWYLYLSLAFPICLNATMAQIVIETPYGYAVYLI